MVCDRCGETIPDGSVSFKLKENRLCAICRSDWEDIYHVIVDAAYVAFLGE